MGASGKDQATPIRVVFLGAGASKAAGLPLASELYDALVSPADFGVDPHRSESEGLPSLFAARRESVLRLIDEYSSESVTGLRRIELTVDHLQCLTDDLAISEKKDIITAQQQLQELYWCFDILLHPTYNASARPRVYLEAAYGITALPGWTAIICTNWDYLLDVSLECAADSNGLVVDWGLGLPNAHIWQGFVPLLADYCWKERRQPFVSLWKPNGSFGWLGCQADSLIFARHFYRPYNLDSLRSHNSLRKLTATLPGNDAQSPSSEFACPKCGGSLLNDFMFQAPPERRIQCTTSCITI